jgi:hypothetical protein
MKEKAHILTFYIHHDIDLCKIIFSAPADLSLSSKIQQLDEDLKSWQFPSISPSMILDYR